MSQQRAVFALLIACAGWGGSFTWAKALMAGINPANPQSMLGVLIVLGWRFLVAGVLWIILLPGARTGWTLASLARVALLGLPFTAAMILQQMGLTRTAPAVNAFLTSLNVLFVPMIVAILTRRLPNRLLAISIALAVAGIWMLSDAGPAGIGAGELLGVGCSILFSVHILLINTLISRDTPARMVAGQFLFSGIAAMAIALVFQPAARQPAILFAPFSPHLLGGFAMLVMISTLLAFGLMLYFQPGVDPTRAAIIYLTEPIFAAAYAWIFAGIVLHARQLAGAGLIIGANALVEWLQRKRPIVNSAVIDGNRGMDPGACPIEPLVLSGQHAKMALPAQGPTD